MPFSAKQGKNIIEKWLREHTGAFDSMVDFGAGAGFYGKMIKEIMPKKYRIAVEGFEPYIKKYRLSYLYQKIIVADFAKMELPDADLAILGDVVEHMPKDTATEFMGRVVAKYPHVIVSIPVGSYPQGAYFGNELERHLSEWTIKELDSLFKNFSIRALDENIGVFIK
jgi:hypothetical protein